MKSQFRLKTAVLFSLVTLFFISACSKEPMLSEDTQLASRPAKLMILGQNSNDTFLKYPATVKAENVSALSFEVGGVVSELLVVESQEAPGTFTTCGIIFALAVSQTPSSVVFPLCRQSQWGLGALQETLFHCQ